MSFKAEGVFYCSDCDEHAEVAENFLAKTDLCTVIVVCPGCTKWIKINTCD